MKKIKPFLTSKRALASLDNGGRFYNLLSKAEDGNVTSAELAKVAGVFGDRQKMILYLAMTISELDGQSTEEILFALSDDLSASYKKYRPQHLSPGNLESDGKLTSNAIVKGIPKHIKSTEEFNGFIMIPISTGKSITMMMVPLIDHYDVYELRDQSSDEHFIIAHSRQEEILPEESMRFGGMLKELKADSAGKAKGTLFLEVNYYMELNP